MGSFLLGVGKLLSLVAVAGGIGMALGLGLSSLSTNGDLPPPAAGPATTGDTTFAAATSATTATQAAGPVTTTSTTTRAEPRKRVELKIVSAVLHPAGTPAGRRRERARIGVRIQIENAGERPIAPERPKLLAAGVAVRADPHVPGALLPPLGTGESADVSLRFEVEGRVTRRLRSAGRARLRAAGRTVPMTVAIGAPVAP